MPPKQVRMANEEQHTEALNNSQISSVNEYEQGEILLISMEETVKIINADNTRSLLLGLSYEFQVTLNKYQELGEDVDLEDNFSLP